ncbi:uncharacterized protein LOC126756996 [Bactrocera neohumeralis]|uniref:uncharacterized protein LOC126756996 n=1 Tax=Bactrocera neohumeralis TaxID=98809 RepID=UPI0021661000|nr:uncharacterized protein LOC126756996 [Bactrocera neohumeralis]
MAATTPAVFITVPKYVAISHTPTMTLPKIRPAPMTTSSQGTINANAVVEDGASAPRGKKRRLDHLTWEEKIQRKKLKNRVAAQTSRDRKKARMEDMEHEIDELTQKTEILQNKCESLQAINESLLEKNRKLDMEVELLRQKLNEVQQQQKKQQEQLASNAAKLNAKTTVETCAGSAAGINSNGLTVDRRTTEKEQLSSVTVEDYCTLPTLQDMLLVDEEFDASKLEELAESLLADIAADMEAGDGACNENVAKVASNAERLPGSVVGTKTECLESSQHTNTQQSVSLNDTTWTSSRKNDAKRLQNKSPTAINDELKTMPNSNPTIASATTTTTTPTITTDNEIFRIQQATDIHTIPPDTVYGTYDAKTNSITIVMDDDAVPVNEAVEEIYCDGVTPQMGDEIKYPTPATTPSHVFLNVVDDSDDDFNFDPIERFLRPKRPLAKSPAPSLHSTASDHGYESIIGSPTSTATEQFDASVEDFGWQGSFNDLFPSLI